MTAPRFEMRFEMREGGWIRAADVGLELAIRFLPGRILEIAEMAAAHDPSVDLAARVGPMLIASYRWANNPGRAEDLRLEAKRRAALSPRERETLDARHLAEPGLRSSWGESVEAEAAQIAAVGVLEAPYGSALCLEVPPDRFKPAAFYEAVARLHERLAPATRNTAAVIAQANDVDTATVYGWLKEARRRGLLPPARERTSDG